jgi:hypothetical protein
MSPELQHPFALSLSKPVLSDASGGVEGGSPERREGSALRSAQQRASTSLSPNGDMLS